MKKIRENASAIALMIALTAPLVYLLGAKYYEGQLAAYGLPDAFFSVSQTRSYIEVFELSGRALIAVCTSLISALDYLLTPPGCWYSAGAIILVTIGIYLRISKKLQVVRDHVHKNWLKFLRNSRVVLFIRYLNIKRNDFSKSLFLSGLAAYFGLLVAYIVIAFTFIVIGIPQAAHAAGYRSQKDRIEEYSEKGCIEKEKPIYSNCIAYRSASGDSSLIGLLVAQSDDYVAIYTHEGPVLTKVSSGDTLRRASTGLDIFFEQ